MRKGFTLIELLVVVAILAVLAVVVVLTMNPVGLLQEARDNNRISDMATLNTALGLFAADVFTANSLGVPNTVYVSIPDPTLSGTQTSTCSSLGLPVLPTGYSYQCSSPVSYRLTNGTGWIPVNFSQTTFGTPLSKLPTDPTNTPSSRFYYTYSTNGTQFEVTAAIESAKYKLGGSADVVGPDGGTLATVLEKGSKLGLEPLDYGDPTLVGNWTFDEGSNATAYDYSGNGNNGSWNGSLIGGSHYAAGKVGTYAGNFDGSTDWVNVPATSSLNVYKSFTASVWVNPTTSADVLLGTYAGNYIGIQIDPGLGASGSLGAGPTTVAGVACPTPFNVWSLVTFTYDGSNIRCYVNAQLVGGPAAVTAASWAGQPLTIMKAAWYSSYNAGLVDDVRIYGRALSAAEVAALYAGGK